MHLNEIHVNFTIPVNVVVGVSGSYGGGVVLSVFVVVVVVLLSSSSSSFSAACVRCGEKNTSNYKQLAV